jgi:hypothetical protein
MLSMYSLYYHFPLLVVNAILTVAALYAVKAGSQFRKDLLAKKRDQRIRAAIAQALETNRKIKEDQQG